MDDGVINKDENKAIKRAHQRELASRHRGVLQFAAVRTAVWMKDGLKSRVVAGKNKVTGQQSRKRTSPSFFSVDAPERFHSQQLSRAKRRNALSEQGPV
jgi:hypothetical protein